jgi:hypothetical protein
MSMRKLSKDNFQHIAGLMVGLVNRFTGKRYGKEMRGTKWFSTVAANLVAEREVVEFAPYKWFTAV